MELDVLGFATLHRIASRFGDGLKPELLTLFQTPPEAATPSSVIEAATTFQPSPYGMPHPSPQPAPVVSLSGHHLTGRASATEALS